MRSKIADRIMSKTTKKTKDFVKKYSKKKVQQYDTAWELVGDRNVWQIPLTELISIVDDLFPISKPKLTCYNYSINRFPYGWKFTVTNSWQKWSEAGFEHDFGAYNQPEFCIAAFLDYVIKNKIRPHKLYEF